MKPMKGGSSVPLRSFTWTAIACGLLVSCSERRDGPPDPQASAGTGAALEGQSGSEAVPDDYIPGSADWISCPCGMNASAWLEASVVGLRDQRLELSLESVLFGDVELELGDSFSGDYDGTLLCGGTECQQLTAGDRVLVGYYLERPSAPACAALDECLESCREELAADAPSDGLPVADTCPASCEEETTDECPEAPPADPRRGRLLVVRWQDPLVLAKTAEAEMTLALDDVGLLWEDPEQCNANWEYAFYELDGYPLPYYSTEAEKVVTFPELPECD